MRGAGLSWAKTTCRSQPLEKEAGGWAGFCWGSENRSALCQHPLVLLAEEGDAARWAACLVKKASELWAQRLLVSKL